MTKHTEPLHARDAVSLSTRPAVFLDRDGVIVESDVDVHGVPHPPWSVDDTRIVDRARDDLAKLVRAGFRLVVVTNQPDVARGGTTLEDVSAINEKLLDELPILDVYMCVHDRAEGCPCRKPRPGMLLAAAADWGLDLGGSWLVGDRWVDIAAGEAAGVKTVLLERTYSWGPTSEGVPPPGLAPTHSQPTLSDCVGWLLRTAPLAPGRGPGEDL